MQLGAQMFTVREFTQTTESLAETLRRIADIGYHTVQISATCPFEPEWMRDRLTENGLSCVLTHTPVPRLIGETATVAREHAVFGCDRVGLGWYSFDETKGDTYAKFKETFLPVAKALHGAGKLFMYHNHDQEFKRLDGKLILEYIMEDFPAEILGFTLDTFWVQAGGGDPAQWLEKLAGRIPCIHLKDYAYGRKMAVVGEGNINFDRVFEKAEAGGTEYLLVEQDDCNGEDPFECLRRSYAYLKSCGFE